MGLWHIDTLDFGNVQYFQLSSARIAVLGFLLDGRLFSSRTGSRAAAPACVIGFCRHFLTPFLEKMSARSRPPLITLLISPFSRTKPQAAVRSCRSRRF